MNVSQQIKSPAVKSQEKYGFTVKDGRADLDFGPFDTREAASKTAKSLTESGLTVSDVKVIWTVATARNLATVRRAKMTPPADQTQGATKAS